jgi:hypothetical protein
MDAAAILAEKYGKPAVTNHRVRGYATLTDAPSVSHDARTAAVSAYEEKRARLDTSHRNISDGAALDAKQAYEERSARIANAWQKKQQDADAPTHTQDAAQAKGLADSAWQEKKARLQNAWRAR